MGAAQKKKKYQKSFLFKVAKSNSRKVLVVNY